jgi:uncharacterized protein
MASTEKTECPICSAEVERKPQQSKNYPFCSERCQLVDLSHWLDESYKIPDDAQNGQ